MSNLTNDKELVVSHPTDNIMCKTCRFKDDGTPWSNDYHKAHCQKFPHPEKHKPIEVMFRGMMCSEYRKEVNADESTK